MAFRALYSDEGKDTITGPDGTEWSLWDLETIYTACLSLPPRQAQSIQLFLVGNMREADVAEMMGLSRTNPIGMYATTGLEKIVSLIVEGKMPRFKMEER